MAKNEITIDIILTVDGVSVTRSQLIEFLNQDKFKGKVIDIKPIKP